MKAVNIVSAIITRLGRDMPAMPTPDPRTATPAQQLAEKIARIEALRHENAADFRPSFVAMIERCGLPEQHDYRKAA